MPQIIKVKVIPKSSQSKVVEEKDGFLKVKLTSAPVDGEANKELIKLLAKHFKKAKSGIEIVKGLKAKEKIIKIHD